MFQLNSVIAHNYTDLSTCQFCHSCDSCTGEYRSGQLRFECHFEGGEAVTPVMHPNPEPAAGKAPEFQVVVACPVPPAQLHELQAGRSVNVQLAVFEKQYNYTEDAITDRTETGRLYETVSVCQNKPAKGGHGLSLGTMVARKFARFPQIVNWVSYHRLVGVDHFYIYFVDDAPDPPTPAEQQQEDQFMALFGSYVTLVPWKVPNGGHDWPGMYPPYGWVSMMQVPVFINCIWRSACFASASPSIRLPSTDGPLICRFRDDTEWLGILDVDEYLVPLKRDANLKQVVLRQNASEIDGEVSL